MLEAIGEFNGGGGHKNDADACCRTQQAHALNHGEGVRAIATDVDRQVNGTTATTLRFDDM